MNEPTTDITTIATQTQADQNPARVYLVSLGKGSRATMFSALAISAAYISGSNPDELWSGLSRAQRHAAQTALLDSIAWHKIRYEHVQALRSILSSQYKPRTANRMLTALRQVMIAAWHLNQMSTDDLGHARAVKGVHGDTDDITGRSLTKHESATLLKTCHTGKADSYRDAAIICIGLGAGLRRHEIARLTTDSYHDGKLTVLGKRNKTRTIPLPAFAKDALDAWLTIRGAAPGSIFTPINRWGDITITNLTPEAIRHIILRRTKQAGINDVTPHDLRRTYATNLIAAGVPLPTVQKLMGHASVTTTANYDRSDEDAKVAAAQTLTITESI